MSNNCLNCNAELKGRADQKFCDPYCKSAYHYQKNKEKYATSFYTKVDKQLKLNRRILAKFNQSGKSTIRKSTLLEAGFDSNFFTHYWKTNEGQVYLFCYEYGFSKIHQNGREKYLLVTWQKYMGQGPKL